MTRLLSFVAGALLLPMTAAAQGLPPIPPAAPLPPPAPAATPARPAPPAPPEPPAPRARDGALPFAVDPFHFDVGDMEDVERQMERMTRDEFPMNAELQRAMAEQARHAAEQARDQMRSLEFQFERGGRLLGAPERAEAYNSGLRALDQRQYDRAILYFDRAIAQKGDRTDGALYWKAFAHARLAQTDDALATIAMLRRDYPKSRYLNDGQVLETDVRKLAGQRIDPQTLDANDEIKLLAINGIANSDPDRAIPLLENVLNASNTLGNKRRALFVLARSTDQRAQQILLRYAKGGGNPELQADAIRYIASRAGNGSAGSDLREIYQATTDPTVKMSIIQAYRGAGDKTALLAIAKAKAESPDVKRSAISGLSNLAAPAELRAIYQQEPDTDLRIQIVSVLSSMGAVDEIAEVVRTEKDAAVRQRAIRSLGNQKSDRTGKLLVDFYNASLEREAKVAIISSLGQQNNAEGLVNIAGKEQNLDLKRVVVQHISNLAPKNKVAADYLLDVIK